MRRVRIFVEGPTERIVLPSLLRALGITTGVEPPLVLRGSKFFVQIARRATAILLTTPSDHVFACPDLAPKEHVPWPYEDYAGLQEALRQEVRVALSKGLGRKASEATMERFHPHPFRHDFEVLLLAMPDALSRLLRAGTEITQHYNSHSPEDQNFVRYPKKVVHGLFRRFRGDSYNDVDDYPKVIQRATSDELMRVVSLCPRFGELIAAIRRILPCQ